MPTSVKQEWIIPQDIPTDNYTVPNDKVALTNGNGNKIGPSIILKVMAGDKVNLRASSWYKTNGANPGNPNSMAADLVAAFINSLTGTGGFEHGSVALAELENSGAVPAAINSFLGTQPAPGSTKPKAYLNWVLLDACPPGRKQFKFVQSSSGAEQVGADQEFKVHTKTDVPITKNGYLYVFVSNETPNINVYFDNLQITHMKGPILEETHYYPFGLTMAGISSKALNNAPDNPYKFNGGTELNSTFDVQLYETRFRGYDPQSGRFWQVDPLTESNSSWSAYSFVQNNPLLYLDPLGLDTTINGVFHEWNGGYLDEVVVYMPKKKKYGIYWWKDESPTFGQAGTLFSSDWSGNTEFVESSNSTPSKQGVLSNSEFDADRTNLGLGAASISLGIQGGILDYGVRTNYKSARTISEFNKLRPGQQSWRQIDTYGKSGQKLLKVVNGATKGLGYTQEIIIIADVYKNKQLNASHLLEGTITALSFIPGWGWVIGGGYYMTDLMTRGITGQSIGQHLDNVVGGSLKEW